MIVAQSRLWAVTVAETCKTSKVCVNLDTFHILTGVWTDTYRSISFWSLKDITELMKDFNYIPKEEAIK